MLDAAALDAMEADLNAQEDALLEGEEAESTATPIQDDLQNLIQEINESLRCMTPLCNVWDICARVLNGERAMGQAGNAALYNIASSVDMAGSQFANFNLLLEPYRTIISKMGVNIPAPTVLPATDSPDDQVKSQALELLLSDWYRTQHIDAKLNKGLQSLLTTGNVGLYLWQDSRTETTVLETVAPYNMVFEPYVTDWQESRYCVIRRFCTKAELARSFPDHKAAIDRMPTAPSTDTYQKGPQTQPKNRLEYWELIYRDADDNGMHPAAYIVPNGSLLLWEGVLPTYPVYLVRYTPVLGRTYGKGIIEPAIEPMRLFNLLKTYQLHNSELTANPQLLVHTADAAAANDFVNTPGGIIRYGSSEGSINLPPPQFLTPPSMPAYAQNLTVELQSLVLDMVGIHSTSLGKRQGGVTSGVAIEALTDNDATQLEVTMLDLAEGVSKISTSALAMMQAYMSDQRMIRSLDQYGDLVFAEIHRTEIEGPAPEVLIESSTLFRSKQESIRTRVLQDMQLGLISPEEAKEKLRSKVQLFPDTAYMQDLRHAKDVLDAVVRLQAPVKFYPSDNLKVLRDVFDRFMRQPSFYELDPDTQNLVGAAYDDLLAMQNPNMTTPQRMTGALGGATGGGPVGANVDSVPEGTTMETAEAEVA